jgi:hypothetical protein
VTVSLRARLALVLACVMTAPLIAAWGAVGILVPRISGRAAQAAVDRAAVTAGGAEVVRVVVLQALGGACLADLAGRLGLTGTVMLLRTAPGGAGRRRAAAYPASRRPRGGPAS